jgi:hypothetical protein
MNNTHCSHPRCKTPAVWTSIPGFDGGHGARLCAEHWRELSHNSPLQAECYQPVVCSERFFGRERGVPSRIGPRTRRKTALQGA